MITHQHIKNLVANEILRIAAPVVLEVFLSGLRIMLAKSLSGTIDACDAIREALNDPKVAKGKPQESSLRAQMNALQECDEILRRVDAELSKLERSIRIGSVRRQSHWAN